MFPGTRYDTSWQYETNKNDQPTYYKYKKYIN